MLRNMGTARLLLALAAILWLASGGVALAANNSEQVVFSGTGGGTFSSTSTPFGFWIWCESEGSSTQPGPQYIGRCSGAMYFYALGIVRGVQGTVAGSSGAYMMSVSSADAAVSCALTNTAPATKGPTNTVTVACSAPAGGGTSTNSVVKVTGP